MKVSLLTPTCNRPEAILWAGQMMERQTRRPDQWVIADGGMERCAFPYPGDKSTIVVRWPQPPGPNNFCTNLVRGLEWVDGDVVVFIEDDDWYHPEHIASVVDLLERTPEAWAAGDPLQRYYNVPLNRWREFNNTGASLCQTALRRAAIPMMRDVILECMKNGKYGVDTTFWRKLPIDWWALSRMDTVVGIKGLKGQKGLGIGHRPGGGWNLDPDGSKLREWVGDDAEIYQTLADRPETAV